MGPVATEADRAEARDLVWRMVVGEKGLGLRAWDGQGTLPAYVDDRARASVRIGLRVMDLRLIQRWQRRHARAGDQLERRLRAVIYARVRRVLLPAGWHHDAIAEAACEAWLKVVPATLRWRPDGGTSLENWVGQSVERAAKSMIRDANAAKRLGLDVPLATVSERTDPGPNPEEAARQASFVAEAERRASGQMSTTAFTVAIDILRGASIDAVCADRGVSRNYVYKAMAALKQVMHAVADDADATGAPEPPD